MTLATMARYSRRCDGLVDKGVECGGDRGVEIADDTAVVDELDQRPSRNAKATIVVLACQVPGKAGHNISDYKPIISQRRPVVAVIANLHTSELLGDS